MFLHALDIRDPDVAIDLLTRGAHANRTAPCRRGSLDVIAPDPACPLIATGDLHDSPARMARLLELAGMTDPDQPPAAHLTLHELIHPPDPPDGIDLSFRALVRTAAVKAAFPNHLHALLANHELAQIVGAGIIKDGVNVVKLFNDGVKMAYRERAADVDAAIRDFVRSMPLGLRITGAAEDGRDLLCLHSLPDPTLIDRFDPSVLERDITEDDYQPRRGSAHILVWGREQSPELIERLADRWNVGGFVLGHEKAERGTLLLSPLALVLNTDHDGAVYVPVDFSRRWSATSLQAHAIPLKG